MRGRSNNESLTAQNVVPESMLIHPDRLLPADPSTRKIARTLYESVRILPIVRPHGHTQAKWFAATSRFGSGQLFVQPDHYILRMLYSQGVSLNDFGIGSTSGIDDPRKVWHFFARHYSFFRGTPTRLWLDFSFQELFGMQERLSEKTADAYFDAVSAKLQTESFAPAPFTSSSM